MYNWIEDAIKDSLRIAASTIPDEKDYRESLDVISKLNVNLTVERVKEYLIKELGEDTLKEVDDFLNGNKYLMYLQAVARSANLITDDIQTYVKFVMPLNEESNKKLN